MTFDICIIIISSSSSSGGDGGGGWHYASIDIVSALPPACRLRLLRCVVAVARSDTLYGRNANICHNISRTSSTWVGDILYSQSLITITFANEVAEIL